MSFISCQIFAFWREAVVVIVGSQQEQLLRVLVALVMQHGLLRTSWRNQAVARTGTYKACAWYEDLSVLLVVLRGTVFEHKGQSRTLYNGR